MGGNRANIEARPLSLAVVIPARDAAATLGASLRALEEARERFALRVTVVDGGSRDATAGIARKLGAEVIESRPGRGTQLAAGAGTSDSDWLLFLHADTVLAPGWSAEALRFARAPKNARRAAAFRFVLDDESGAARRIESFVAWRCRALGLAYGDQGLLLSRRFYEALGGFRPIPLMEDVDMVRRITRKRLAILESAAVTSAARYRAEGYLSRGLRNLACLALFFAGIPPKLIARLYG